LSNTVSLDGVSALWSAQSDRNLPLAGFKKKISSPVAAREMAPLSSH
jgi:hypothetical protein